MIMATNKYIFNDGKVIHGDCIHVLEQLPNDSIDLIFTSPPYCVGKSYDKYNTIEGFTEIISATQKLLVPKLKVGGSLCWQVGNHVKNATLLPLDFVVHKICERYSNLILRNRIIWTFGHGTHAKRRLSGRYETVLWYTKGSEYRFNLDSIRVPQKYPGKTHYKGPSKGKVSGNPLGKNPGDVWSIPNVKANHVEKTDHPCQFPVALAARFIKALTPEGGTVLDPFAGTCTTAISALELGRKFVCIELEEEYFRYSEKRISDWYNGTAKIRADVPAVPPKAGTAVATRPGNFL